MQFLEDSFEGILSRFLETKVKTRLARTASQCAQNAAGSDDLKRLSFHRGTHKALRNSPMSS